MAHIPDGILSLPVLIGGAAIGVAGCAHALRRMEPHAIPQISVLSAVFFVASLVHFPVGPSSVHLLLNGLTGIILGWAAFPAIAVALLLQAVLFGFGGIVVLGVNLTNMAVPAVICGLIFRAIPRRRPLAAALIGGGGVMLTALAVSLTLAAGGQAFWTAAQLVIVSHLPVMVIEGAFSAAAIGLIQRVKPEILESHR